MASLPLAPESAWDAMLESHLKSAFVVSQVAKALPGLEARGLLGRDELPLMRCLCRAIIGNAPAEIDFDRLFQDEVT